MTDSKTTKAAAMLMSVRRGNRRIAGLGDLAPQNEAEAFAIQREVLRVMGGQIGGYKCAAPPGKATSAAIMPLAGFRRAPCRWDVVQGDKIGIETEIAFRFARGLPARGTPYSQAEVLDAVDGCCPIVELVSSRYQDMKAVSGLESMADNISHAGFVMGADVADWRSRDLNALTVRQSCGGAVQVEKVGGNPSGDPFVPLVWLANWLPSVGLAIEAGQVVTTGSCTGLIFVDGNQQVRGEFLGFGEVVLDLV